MPKSWEEDQAPKGPLDSGLDALKTASKTKLASGLFDSVLRSPVVADAKPRTTASGSHQLTVYRHPEGKHYARLRFTPKAKLNGAAVDATALVTPEEAIALHEKFHPGSDTSRIKAQDPEFVGAGHEHARN
jgi:hypothetical protein